MTDVNDAVVARLKKSNEPFEVLVDCEKALAYRSGKGDIRDALAVQKIFYSAHKGMEASSHLLLQLFSTENPLEVAAEIIKKGEIQLTAEFKHNLREQKRKQMVDIIHRNGVDPSTHLPHPIIRLENAFDEAKITVDEFEDVHKQVDHALKKLRPILPIKFETKEIDCIIPPDYAHKVAGVFAHYGKTLKQDWMNNGALHAVVEISGGLEPDFYSEINKVCHGKADCKVLKIR